MQRMWPDIVEAVKRKSRVAWMVIMSGVQPIALDGNLLTLSFDTEGKRTNFTQGGRDVVLREVLRERMGVEWRVDTVMAGQAPSGGRSGGYGARPAAPSPAPANDAFNAAPAPRPAPPRNDTPPPPPDPGPPPPDEPPPPPEPGPIDEREEVDPEGDADADGTEAEMSGMALIQRELGGQVIREIDNT
ncbi:hypothetical protein GCM10009678_40530 [Actinomadura kijaniata]|uniref:hypothetical protein n=1 Tax=Actinomadura kijaniata TaxID=46161 RepID=UPI002FEC4617